MKKISAENITLGPFHVVTESSDRYIADGFEIPFAILINPAVIDSPDSANMLRAAHWDAVKAERDKRIQTGGYQAVGKWFHSDTFSRTQQMGLVMMGASIPGGLQWKTMDGSFVTMTQTLAGQVFAAAAASDADIFARAEQIKATMEADPAAFDLAAHAWPPVFGG